VVVLWLLGLGRVANVILIVCVNVFFVMFSFCYHLSFDILSLFESFPKKNENFGDECQSPIMR